MMVTSIYYLHEIGGKKNQEDSIWPAPGTAGPNNNIFIVCDGVGGSENGEIASRMIADYMGNYLAQTQPESISINYVNSLLLAAKDKLVAYARTGGLNKNMATTLALLVLFHKKAFIAWCGDSRVYHIRNGNVLYQTTDHSLVNSLVRSGDISAEEAATHPKKHIILKAITGDDTISEAEGHWVEEIATGDYFLLCTDGLLENIDEHDLKHLLSDNTSKQRDLVAAIQEKSLGKTRDNYSMYLLQVDPQAIVVKKKKAVKSKKAVPPLAWFILIFLAAGAIVLWFVYREYYQDDSMPPGVGTDSLMNRSESRVNKDTLLPAVGDSDINRELPGERRIAPAPLPETVPDSARFKKQTTRHTADTVYVNPHALIKDNEAVSKKDSTKHG